MNNAGLAKLFLGSYEQAEVWCQRAIEANRNFPHPHFLLGSALALLGRLDEAESAARIGLALNPAFSLPGARGAWSAMSDEPTYLAQIEPVLEGLRKAGVPEQ
jgi:tetratricopeptide (TPR) repeat protein